MELNVTRSSLAHDTSWYPHISHMLGNMDTNGLGYIGIMCLGACQLLGGWATSVKKYAYHPTSLVAPWLPIYRRNQGLNMNTHGLLAASKTPDQYANQIGILKEC